MKILMLYNQQRSVHGGEEVVVDATVSLLRDHGHEVDLAVKSSRGTEASALRKVGAAVGGVFNPFSFREVTRLIRQLRPDVLHAHNIFPNWSPSVFAAAGACGVPSLYSVHSQILTCPTWYHLRDGAICERCLDGEHWCVLSNCRGSLVESAVYAARSAAVRLGGLVRDRATLLVAMSDFQRDQLIRGGYPTERIAVVPNMVAPPPMPADPADGAYIAFVGRLSPEKGLGTFLEAARRLPEVPFRIAGGGPLAETALRTAPPNVAWVGTLGADALAAFYRGARIVAVPSLSYETFCMVAAESLSHGVPVVASAVGAVPEILDEGRFGALVPPGDADRLADALAALWRDPERCRSAAAAGRQAVLLRYTADRCLDRLLAAYGRARQLFSDGAPRSLPALRKV